MARITDLKFQKNKKRVNVFLDGRYYCGLQYETTINCGLYVGADIEEQKIESIQLESEVERAKEIALNLLERKLYSRNELAKKLTTKGFLPNTIDAVIIKLAEYGYVNDLNYVKSYCSDNGKRSKKDLAYKLKAKGIGDDTINSFLENVSAENEFANCKYWAEKYHKINNGKKNFQQKIISHLIGKGFAYETIRLAIKSYIGDVEYE